MKTDLANPEIHLRSLDNADFRRFGAKRNDHKRTRRENWKEILTLLL